MSEIAVKMARTAGRRDGAVLVRPVQVVVWRRKARGGDPAGVFRKILGR